MAPRATSNPLALAVLATLCQHPMHPYEMATTMRAHHYDTAVKLNYGSLYSVVDSLLRRGLIDVESVERSGKRPERTVYSITPAGRAALSEWLRSVLSTPAREYTAFPAALAFMVVLDPSEVRDRLMMRAEHLAADVADTRAMLGKAMRGGEEHPPVQRVFLIEDEYQLAMREAELAWVHALIQEIETGTLPGIDTWQQHHTSQQHNDDDLHPTDNPSAHPSSTTVSTRPAVPTTSPPAAAGTRVETSAAPRSR